MATPVYDGTWTRPNRNGPIIVSHDPETKATMFTHELRMRADSYALADNVRRGTVAGGMLYSMKDINGGYFVDWTPPRHVDCGIVEWTRTFSLIPPTRTVQEEYAASYQYVEDDQLGAVTLTVTASVTYSYHYLTEESAFTYASSLEPAWIYFAVGSTLYVPDGATDPGSDPYKLAEDESLTRWKGFIWQKRRVMIPNKIKVAA